MTTEITEINIDLDGVLADFTSEAIRQCLPPGKFKPSDCTSWNWIEQHVPREILDSLFRRVWFWENIPAYPWANELVEALRATGCKLRFITNAQGIAEAEEGKTKWLIAHGFSDIPVVFTADKHKYAHPNAVLIDDSNANCEAWRKAGGRDILFPQYWNSRLAPLKNPVPGIELYLLEIKQQLGWKRHQQAASVLPTDAALRKSFPMATGLLDCFPRALAAVANCSKVGNDQHNPGQPLHWAKEKSKDHADALIRHMVERGAIDTDGVRHSTKVALRALALLQTELEAAEKQLR
jgi:5'(3')-deoxyribonucleotidase